MSHQLSPEEIQYQLQHIHEDRSSDLIVTFATCTALAYVAVILRLIARRANRTQIQADDCWALIALCLLTGQMIVGLMGVQLGAGKHVILLQNPSEFAKVVISMEVLYVAGTAAAKFSILLLYRRLFGLYKRFLIALYCVATITFCYSLVQILVIIFQCQPVNAAWNFHIERTCVDLVLGGIIVGSVNVATDFVTLILPMSMVWHLNIETKWKIQLVGIFLLGGFVCIGSIYRVTVLNGLSHPDATWASTPAAIWAFVENAIGIVSACLPTLRPIYNILIHGHHCSIREKCTRCQTSRQKVTDYITSSEVPTSNLNLGEAEKRSSWKNAERRRREREMMGIRGEMGRGRWTREPETPPTTYTTPPSCVLTPPTTYTTPAGSQGGAESETAGMGTFWVSDSTESSPPHERETPSIEIW